MGSPSSRSRSGASSPRYPGGWKSRAPGVRLSLRKLNAERLRAAVHRGIELHPGAERVARAFVEAGGPTAAADALEGLVAGGGALRD